MVCVPLATDCAQAEDSDFLAQWVSACHLPDRGCSGARLRLSMGEQSLLGAPCPYAQWL